MTMRQAKNDAMAGLGGKKISIIDLLHWLLYTGRQGDYVMEQTFEATIDKRHKWYLDWVDTVPEAFTQGRRLKMSRKTLRRLCNLYWRASGN
jgi:hypothetical protein